MKDYNKEYKKIMDECLKKGFSKLKNKKISVRETKKENDIPVLAITFYWILFSNIILSKKLRKNTKQEIKAIIAHELGHIQRFEECNTLEKLWKGLKYFTSKKYRLEEEKACDKISIQQGNSKGLYAIRKKRKSSKYYLKPKEIKLYAQKIKKW